MITKKAICSILAGAVLLASCSDETGPAETTQTPELATSTSTSGSWVLRPSLPTPRSQLGGTVVQNAAGDYIMYAIGGSNAGNKAMKRMEAYNANTNTWSRKADMPAKRGLLNGAASIGGKIYVAGGADTLQNPTNTLFVYTPSTNTWARKADVPVKSTAGISIGIDGKLYLITANRLYRYDPATNTWQRRADPINNRSYGAGALINGKLYVAKGLSWGVDMYDPATDRWSNKTTFDPIDGGHLSVAGLNYNNKLYVVGGTNYDEDFKSTYAYDPVSNSWTEKASMRSSRSWGAAGKIKNAAGQLQILMVGGSSNSAYPAPTEAYTP